MRQGIRGPGCKGLSVGCVLLEVKSFLPKIKERFFEPGEERHGKAGNDLRIGHEGHVKAVEGNGGDEKPGRKLGKFVAGKF